MVERVKSGIPGFDELVQGEIPKRNIVLLSGGPGTADLLARPRELYAPFGADHWFPSSIWGYICHLRGSEGGQSSPTRIYA